MERVPPFFANQSKPISMHRLNSTAAAAALRLPPPLLLLRCHFRSQSALDSLHSHASTATNGNSTLILYNYPSFSGAYAALFAHRFHSRLRLPFLLLPFSSVAPLRLEDFEYEECFKTCYLLDFIGPKNFALELSRIIPRVIAFDHRESSVARISDLGQIPENLELNIDTNKTSARAVRDYFLKKDKNASLLDIEDGDRVEKVLRYVEDIDLRRFKLPDVGAFKIGIKEEMAKLNCVTNPYVFEQLLDIDCDDLIAKGNSYVNSRHNAATELLGKPFKIRLGGGTYGECLAVRADGHSDLSHEMCLELGRRSQAAGLRPIGAAIFIQRKNLKMCLRSIDDAVDTSEIAKAYGGGGKRSSSSFIIRMDEYHNWIAKN